MNLVYLRSKKGRGFFRRKKNKIAKSLDGLSHAAYELQSESGRRSRYSRRGDDDDANTKFEEEIMNVSVWRLFMSEIYKDCKSEVH